MATVIDHAIDWDAAVNAARMGALNDYLFRDYENEDAEPEKSLEDFTGTDTWNVFGSTGSAYESLRHDLPQEWLDVTDSWFWRIFGKEAGAKEWYADSPEVFGDGAQCFHASFNPETVADLAHKGSAIPFEQMRGLFEARCPKDAREQLTRYSSHPGDPFAGGFVRYLQGWVAFLQHLADSGKGFLIYTG